MKTSAQTIEELQSALHDQGLSKTEFIRVQAVLLRKKKYKRKIIAEMVGKSIHAIEDWVVAYNHRGLEGLKTHIPATPNHTALSNRQREKLCTLLQKKPCDLKIGEEEYWTMGTVKQLVERETKVVYKSDNSYRKLLCQAGMSYQKVEFEDKHKNQANHDEFKKQFEDKVKGGSLSMWW